MTNDESIKSTDGEVKELDLVAEGMEHGERQVELEGQGAERRDHDLQPSPDRDPQIAELVIRRDGTEVGEDDLVERVLGVPGELVLDRSDGHHDAAGGDPEGVGAHRAILEPAQAAEV